MKPKRHSDRPISRSNLRSALQKQESAIELLIQVCRIDLDEDDTKGYAGVITNLQNARRAVRTARQWLYEHKKPHKYETE